MGKSFYLIIEIIVFLFIIGCVSLRFEKTQTTLAQALTKQLSNDLGTTISIGKLNIVPFDKVGLEELIVLDLENDTVLNTKSLNILFSDINLDENKLAIENLTLSDADVNLIKRKGKRGFSFQFIIDHFSGEKKSTNNGKDFLITAKKIELKNTDFKFVNYRGDNNYYGMDFDDLEVNNINLTLSEFTNLGSNIKVKINHLSSNEKSKFVLKNLTGFLEMDSNFAHIDSLRIITPNSSLITDYFRFEFNDPNDFDDDFINLVTMKTTFRNSKLNLKDLSFFTPYFKGIDRTVTISGEFDGLVSDFKSKNLKIKLDKNTYFYGNLAMKGLPETDNTTFDIKINKFTSNELELNKLDIPPFIEHKKMKIPKAMEGFGDFTLKGKLAGKFNDLKGKISAITSQGNLDVEARYWDVNNTTFVEGNVIADNFNLGTFLKNKDLKGLDANVDTKLKWDSKTGIDLKAKGELPKIIYKGYKYTNIKIDGDITESSFNGKASIKDKNGKIDFDGKINMENKIPEFDFKTIVKNLNLTKLKLTTDTVNRMVSADIVINGMGNTLDNSIGLIKIKDLKYIQEGETYTNKEINIVSIEKDSIKTVELLSDIADAKFTGKFNVSKLPNSFEMMGKHMFPAIYEFSDSIDVTNQNFDFKVNVKDYSPIYKLFTPTINIANNSKINGFFNSKENKFEIYSTSDSILFDSKKIENLALEIKKPGDILNAKIDISHFYFNSKNKLDNLVITSLIKKDHIMPTIKWKSDDGQNYGKIQGDGYWYSKEYFDFLILPSYVHFQNRDWKIQEDASLIIDSTSYNFNEIKATNELGESVSITGNVSENPKDLLNIYLDNFKVKNFNSFIGSSSTNYYGNINGSACVSNLYKQMKIESDFYIDKLMVNEELVGDIAFNSNWINELKALHCKGELLRENAYVKSKLTNTFDFMGNYYPFKEEESLDFECTMDKTPLTFLNPYLNHLGFTKISGDASGKVSVKGEPEKPILNGHVVFNNAGLKVDYLNTFYAFTGKVFVEESDIFTDNMIELRDIENNPAQFNATIVHDNFDDIDYNIAIEIPHEIYKKGGRKEITKFKGATQKDLSSNAFLSINTNSELNPDFYGKVYGSGDVNIEGYKGNIRIEVVAKTARGTKFTLPLNGSSEVELEDYVVFVNKNDTTKKEEKIDFTGIDLDLKIEATPDAEMEIIFDEVYGDIIKGVGSGNMHMTVDKNGEFRMQGKYVIDKGDYLFTMGILNFENLVNKKFDIENGSSISWYGDPLNAEVDINTVYNLKASIYEIMGASAKAEGSKYRTRRDVECHMNLSENLLAPRIRFGIEIPFADEDIKRAIAGAMPTEEEMNKQVFALLLLNRFLETSNSNSTSEESRGNNLIGTTTSELLSNQLTSWLSKSSDGLLGFNYRPGDNITSDEIAVQLSKALFNDKLVINSNFGVARGNQTNQNPNQIVGDVNVEYLINDNGTFRVRVFSRTNDYDITNINQSKITSGAGVYFKKEFSKWKYYFK